MVAVAVGTVAMGPHIQGSGSRPALSVVPAGTKLVAHTCKLGTHHMDEGIGLQEGTLRTEAMARALAQGMAVM